MESKPVGVCNVAGSHGLPRDRRPTGLSNRHRLCRAMRLSYDVSDNQLFHDAADLIESMALPEPVAELQDPESAPRARRGRGRPPGSKNRVKIA